MKVYKITYLDEWDRPYEVLEGIEIVRAKQLADYVETMYANGRICEENYKEFCKKHPNGAETESDAIELLKLDGYYVEPVIV